jgi:integrase
MAVKGISIRTVEALAQGEAVWDEAVKGFGVRRQLGAAVYVVKYRVFGRQRFVTIGRHGAPWTPDRARREARRLLGLVAEGKDPQSEKAEAREKAADTLGKVAEAYLARAKDRQKPRSFIEIERHLLVNWAPLHSVSVFDLRRRMVAVRLAEIERERGPVAAARARQSLSAMFNWAIREGWEIDANPVFGTNRPQEPRSRDRVLTDTELRGIWKALGEDQFSDIVRLLLLTAQRRDEIGSLRWSEIDFDRAFFTLPPERSKNHREHCVPLSRGALAILARQPHRKGRELVFGYGERQFSGWSNGKAGLDRRTDTGVVGDWRLHDLRRTAATGMAELGVLPHVIEAILNHVSGHRAGVAGVYNRARYEGEMRTALERWAAHVKGIGEIDGG